MFGNKSISKSSHYASQRTAYIVTCTAAKDPSVLCSKVTDTALPREGSCSLLIIIFLHLLGGTDASYGTLARRQLARRWFLLCV